MTLTINLSDKLLSSIKEHVSSGEFKSVDAFIKKAVKSELLALKRRRLGEIPQDVEELIQKAGMTEEKILDDFEEFRERLWMETSSKDS